MKFRVVCPYCPKTVTAKRKGWKKLQDHIAETHPEIPGRILEETTSVWYRPTGDHDLQDQDDQAERWKS
jgi:hypothetical protein